MIDIAEIQPLLDRDGVVIDESGDKIGKIGQIFLDDATGNPEWVTVSTGLFGSSQSFVPLTGATVAGDDIRVPYAKSQVKDAPRIDAEGHLSPEEEERLYAHYGVAYESAGTYETGTSGTSGTETTSTYETSGTTSGVTGGQSRSETYTEGHDTSGPNTDDAMTRSEEQVAVGTERVQTGKARLRKYVVTENVTTTVPVTREKVRLETEPITDANRGDALSGADITEEEHEVTLSEDRVVVDKQAVPVERVKLGTETVQDEEQVSEEVRKERIELDESDVPQGRRS